MVQARNDLEKTQNDLVQARNDLEKTQNDLVQARNDLEKTQNDLVQTRTELADQEMRYRQKSEMSQARNDEKLAQVKADFEQRLCFKMVIYI